MFMPVVSAQEMQSLDRLAVSLGCKEENFIQEVGKQVSLIVLDRLEKYSLLKSVLLLVGKGNKGADAFSTGICLLERGVKVRALSVFALDACSAMNRLFYRRFVEQGGKVEYFKESMDWVYEEGLILDGLLGTGFQGKVEGDLAIVIGLALRSKRRVISLDIPSGIDGTTGETKGLAIVADETIALGMVKIGCFLRDGWNYVGKLSVVDFGLPKEVRNKAQVLARVPKVDFLASLLPKLVRNRHKYQAGYVVGLSGSKQFRGAPKLAGMAAFRAGAGIVRVFYHQEIGEIPHELIAQPFSLKSWQEEMNRAGSLFIGPGLGKMDKVFRFLKTKKGFLEIPMVFDADAIQEDVEYPSHAILTPHRGEVLRLFKLKKDSQEGDLLARSQKWVQHTNCILVLKGAPTFIFMKDHSPVVIPHGDPGMAKAGTGDVLTGIIAALLAQKLAPPEAAMLSVYIHALAGEIASSSKTSYSVVASDLIECLPLVMKFVSSSR